MNYNLVECVRITTSDELLANGDRTKLIDGE